MIRKYKEKKVAVYRPATKIAKPGAKKSKDCEIPWMSRWLHSLDQVAHEDWIPAQYQSALKHNRKGISNL